MRPRTLLLSLAVLAAAAVCVRLGFWQISRWHEKRAINVELRSALARPPLLVSRRLAVTRFGARAAARGAGALRRVATDPALRARPRRIAGRARGDAARPRGGSTAVLVDRGWLYAADAASARPDESAPSRESIGWSGVAEPLRAGIGRAAFDGSCPTDAGRVILGALAGSRLSGACDSPMRWRRSSLRQLPGPGVPDKPLRGAPRPVDETMHVSYAIQWFLFAAIIARGLDGAGLVAPDARRRCGPMGFGEHERDPLSISRSRRGATSIVRRNVMPKAKLLVFASAIMIGCPPPRPAAPIRLPPKSWPSSATSTGRDFFRPTRHSRRRSATGVSTIASPTSRPPGSRTRGDVSKTILDRARAIEVGCSPRRDRLTRSALMLEIGESTRRDRLWLRGLGGGPAQWAAGRLHEPGRLHHDRDAA